MNRTNKGVGLKPVNRTRLDIARANRLAARSERSTDEILQNLVELLSTAVRQNRSVEV